VYKRQEQFHQLVLHFPALLVAFADHIIDVEEEQQLQKTALELALQFRSSGLDTEALIKLGISYFAEFQFLLRNLSTFEYTYTSAIIDHLLNVESDKAVILNMMQSVALNEAGKNKLAELAEKFFITLPA
jgi:hypothetical protein